MLYRLVPNQGLFPIVIGMSYEQLTSTLHAGRVDQTRGSSEFDVWFDDCNARVTIQDNKVVEVSVFPPSDVLFDGKRLFSDAGCWKYLVASDPQPMESVGFIILNSISVAFTGLHDQDHSQAAITMFKVGRWDVLLPMTPFKG